MSRKVIELFYDVVSPYAWLGFEAGLKAGLSSSEVEELLGLAISQPVKDKLKQTIQEAINYKLSLSPQAFGLPLIVCHIDGKPQVFFGSDRFKLMAHCIGK
ncbi:glutathione S-transferase kappa 1-like [Ictalurus furcatus]|uniref:glutathione S-transferase kappa 1-like n=1 Tax=Ictalurus furcatus TaxID=66913 RepID=UPI002350FC7E|nr:glutathione S-transferase kappa 1-like [Ictalurus furcatus]